MSSDENKSSVERQHCFPLISFTEDVCVCLVSDSILNLIILPFLVTRCVTWQALVLCICLFFFSFFPQASRSVLYFSHNDAIDEQVKFSDSKLFLYKQYTSSGFISNSEKPKKLVKIYFLQVFQLGLDQRNICITHVLGIQYQQLLWLVFILLWFSSCCADMPPLHSSS